MDENEEKLIDQILFGNIAKIDLSVLGLAAIEEHLDNEQLVRSQIAAIVFNYFKKTRF